MSKSAGQIFIGTSGWSYFYWKDNFYLPGLPPKKWLNFYSETFSTVEVNTTFYHLPSIPTVENWERQVNEKFLFSIKASGYITHRKRLHECQEAVATFLERISGLKKKIGPILFQLPPSFKVDLDRLNDFISLLNPEHRYVFEFRHPSWFNESLYEIFTKKNIALCITDLNGSLSPEEVTADFTYIRLHGPQRAYKGSYGDVKLWEWKRKIEKWAKKISVYCYFDNDEKGFAVKDAKTLQSLIFGDK